jgi:hypothetical protein
LASRWCWCSPGDSTGRTCASSRSCANRIDRHGQLRAGDTTFKHAAE